MAGFTGPQARGFAGRQVPALVYIDMAIRAEASRKGQDDRGLAWIDRRIMRAESGSIHAMALRAPGGGVYSHECKPGPGMLCYAEARRFPAFLGMATLASSAVAAGGELSRVIIRMAIAASG